MIKKAFLILFTFFGAFHITAEEHPPIAIAITDVDQFETFIQKAQRPVIIDFWAPWCGPCMKMKPIFEKLAEEQQNVFHFITVNIDEGQQLAEKFEVKGIPTFAVLKQQTLAGKIVGQRDKENLLKEINQVLGNEITIDTLFSAIQEGSLEKVLDCLASKEIDVNGIVEVGMGEITYPMTPLILACSKVIFWNGSHDVVLALIRAGAQVDFEIDTPEMDKEMKITGSRKITARHMIEESAKEKSAEELEAIQTDNIRQFVIEAQKRAKNLLQEIEAIK